MIIKTKTTREEAESSIGDLKLTYTYEYERQLNPSVINFRAREYKTVVNEENPEETVSVPTDFAVDGVFFPTNGNLQFTFHYVNSETTLDFVPEILVQIRQLLNQFEPELN